MIEENNLERIEEWVNKGILLQRESKHKEAILCFDKAISLGLLPFIPSELFKIALAVALIPSLSKFIK